MKMPCTYVKEIKVKAHYITNLRLSSPTKSFSTKCLRMIVFCILLVLRYFLNCLTAVSSLVETKDHVIGVNFINYYMLYNKK